MEETEGFFAIDTVSAGEHLHRGPIAQSQLIVQPTDLGEFAGDLRVEGYGIMVTALDHERTREHQVGQFGMAEGAAHVEMGGTPTVR